MFEITKGGHLELVSEFEVAGGGFVDPHHHPTHEFYYVTAGRGLMEIEGEVREIRQGDLVHIPPNVVHSLRPVSDHVPIDCFCFAVATARRRRGQLHRALSGPPWHDVLVTRRLPDGGLDPLVAAGHEVVARDRRHPFTKDELIAAVADVDAVVCLLTDRIDADVLDAGGGGGCGSSPTSPWATTTSTCGRRRTRGIAVTNTPGVLDETTADLAFLLILGAARLASDAERDLRTGVWDGWEITEYLGVDVHGATLGIVGFGRIGQAVARRASGFGMRVRPPHPHRHRRPGVDRRPRRPARDVGLREPAHPAHRRDPPPDRRPPARPDEADRRAGEHRARSGGRRGRPGRRAARGSAVRRRDRRLRVRAAECAERLLTAPRAMLLPHLGSASVATRTRMAHLACEGAIAVLAGATPPNLVHPALTRRSYARLWARTAFVRAGGHAPGVRRW